ncbi:hypothetical protein [Cellulomonas sp. RIT-PI-Y]|uniref:hypothetical protein n=1 Tax=Cellulomonas sp. RIT-PI-Y TaxID=3035297 RepID=UPI0021D96100|nr:hypothetical protein [Cellulomonas sp. RIT-PI-Y]
MSAEAAGPHPLRYAARRRATTARGTGASLSRWGTRAVVALGSSWAMWLIVAVFVAQASLLAVTLHESLYDESYHLGVIRYFAQGHSPWESQPDDLVRLGDVERYGSYLYHWLLSFPWRWTAGLPLAEHRLVIRLLTVAMVAGALAVIRRLGRVLGLSGLAANVVVLIVAAVPMTTFLGVTVNYDNLAFLLLPVMWLPAVRLLRADRFDGYGWSLFLLAGAALSLTKYSMLPFVAVTGISVLVGQVRAVLRRRSIGLADWRWRPRPILAVLGAVLAVAAMLERYGVNLIRYGSVQPDCAVVHPVSICQTWAPWGRNYLLDPTFPDQAVSWRGLVDYVTHDWLPGTMLTWSFFPVDGSDGPTANYGAHIVGLVLTAGTLGVLALIVLAPRTALGLPGGLTLTLSCALYLMALLSTGYGTARTLGEPLGVQGRYLQPVMVPLLLLAARGLTAVLAANGRRVGIAMRWAGAAVLIAGLSQSGGLIGVLARSEPQWFRETEATAVILELQDRVQWWVTDDALLPDVRDLTEGY